MCGCENEMLIFNRLFQRNAPRVDVPPLTDDRQKENADS